jgi:uncharacterized membrane protein YuzA (DUF378 family)
MGSGIAGKWAHLVAMVLVVVGGLNWGAVGLFGVDLVRTVFGRGLLANVVYVAVGVAAVAVALNRDSYLPFLGETVMPCSLLAERTPDHADTEVAVSGVEPGAKLLYWATEPATEGLGRIRDWRRAYLDFANAGVTTADAGGHAVLRVRRPQPYTVPVKGRLEAHVHWRVCGEGGMLGPVRTTTLTGGPISL